MGSPPSTTMAGIGFYSRHLTEEDVDQIGVTTRSLINRGAGQDIEVTDGTLILNGRKFNKAESILNGLLHSGNYDNIIQNIFKYLNATQLACLQKTCKSWAQFIEDYVWQDVKTLAKLRTYWGSYMPKCFVLTYHRHLISMRCTEQYILCGEEKTGRLIVYNRASLYEPGQDNEPIMPEQRLEAHKDGFSITTIDIEDDLVVTGGSDGGVRLIRLSTGKLLTVLSQSSSMVYQVRIDRLRVFATAGSKVTVQTVELKEGEPESN